MPSFLKKLFGGSSTNKKKTSQPPTSTSPPQSSDTCNLKKSKTTKTEIKLPPRNTAILQNNKKELSTQIASSKQ